MIDIRYVAAIRWDEDLAKRLRSLRGKLSRRALAQKTQELGRGVSHQYIQQLEQPSIFTERLKSTDSLTVSFDVVEVMCKALNADLAELFDSVKVSVGS